MVIELSKTTNLIVNLNAPIIMIINKQKRKTGCFTNKISIFATHDAKYQA